MNKNKKKSKLWWII